MDDYKNYSEEDRIEKLIQDLSSFTELGRPFTRIVFSSEFVDARKWLQNCFVDHGLVSKS